ncbi:AAA family ATPase [uncultured Duncaniella sp.]|uniref:AAA family ATPase n=1 Tax=uncultured Duncaniella sp. TaxID=2768039 RepID=UPI0026010EE5|nr:AAA family ATPase [uncultured Duncaniella sp.]
MKRNAYISLSKLQVKVIDNLSINPSSHESQSFGPLDDRNDFLTSEGQNTIALAMEFTNEKLLSKPQSQTGMRRSVSVSIFDESSEKIIARHCLNVCFSQGRLTRRYTMDIPVERNHTDYIHRLRIIIRDEGSKEIIGKRTINLWNVNDFGQNPASIYQATSGFLSLTDTDHIVPYLSVDAKEFETHTVRFSIEPLFDKLYGQMPELEIKLHYPDGSTESSVCRPQQDRYDFNRSESQWHAETRFILQPQRMGVTYAELRCMGIPISGFLFSTIGPEYFGEWEFEMLDYCTDYSPADGLKRFQELTNELTNWSSNDGSDDTMDKVDFDSRLNEFIASSLGYHPEEDDEDVNADNDEDYDEDIDGDETVTDENQPSDNEKSPEEEIPLDRLVGLEKVKAKLDIYEKIVQFNSLRRKAGLMELTTPLHAMFLGSPGTGKSTVAKHIGKILAKAGILSKGHVIIKERSTLLGQNYHAESEKTIEAIKAAQGGILLIDEAYQLYQPNDPRDPGKFVIETLLTALSDESNRDWMLILAGYPEPMRRMFEMNPGFKSRIPESNIYHFEDFTEGQLMEIAENYFTDHGFRLSEKAATAMSAHLTEICGRRSKDFGNGRYIKNLIETEIIPHMAVRISSAEVFTIEALTVVEESDIPMPRPDKALRPSIGFRA